jgi:hypothetical protein
VNGIGNLQKNMVKNQVEVDSLVVELGKIINMKHLKVFEKFEENKFDIENVMLYMVNILDNYKVNFFDVDHNMVNSNSVNINDFQLTKDFHSIRRSRFIVEIMQDSSKQLSIHDLAEVSIEMSTTIKNLEREGWILSDYYLNQSKERSQIDPNGPGKVVFYYIHYTFSKEDQEIEPSKGLEHNVPFDKLKRILDEKDIVIDQKSTRYLDNSIEIDDWDSESLDYRGVEEVLDDITDILGAVEWEWKRARNGICLHF